MAYLDQWKSPIQLRTRHQEQLIRRDLANHFWLWYEEHKDDVVATLRILFWSKSVYVRDLKGLFIMLFGQS